MAGILKKSSQFFRNVVIEMKKVRWPTRQELISYTVTVLVTVAFLVIFFGVIDLGISQLLRLITE
ncbi:preprotein translocase subunit SecE [Caenibacillus caldisaponilyticus]|jgi:preprotein translocase subunit SecE|uniref:preprotein translocase subunit SecE n=1 Tax=Caenibacillus caldisaponilyticus TaxID=1674942 RepID=UPI001EE73A20|nr:preprotein translocase subunit SecE [Caenibacillus caldisaponilyticus]